MLNHSSNSNKFLCVEDVERTSAMQYLVSRKYCAQHVMIHLVTGSEDDSSTSVEAVLYRATDHLFVFFHGLCVRNILHVSTCTSTSTMTLYLKRQGTQYFFLGCSRYSRPYSWVNTVLAQELQV